MEENQVNDLEEVLDVVEIEIVEDNETQKEHKNDFLKEIFEYVKIIIITVCVTQLVLFFVQISRVVGDSMLPTYQEGNIVLVDKVFYKMGEPEVNDIVVVEYNHGDSSEQIIKRVVAVGGDRIEMKDNTLYRNGELLSEPYIKEAMMYEDNYVYDIPEGKIFVLGDNRNISLDSGELGYFDFKEDVVGRVFIRLLK